MAARAKWDYHVEEVTPFSCARLQEIFDRLAAEGWEFQKDIQTAGEFDPVFFIFRRGHVETTGEPTVGPVE